MSTDTTWSVLTPTAPITLAPVTPAFDSLRMSSSALFSGTAINNPLLGAMTKDPDHMLQGTPAAALLSELGPEASDLVSRRTHGLSPFTGTDLDALLRNMGVTTIVPTGVSVNEALFGLCIEAANLGYCLALPTDAIAGLPRSYAEDVVRYSLSMMCNLTTSEAVLGSWRAHS